ALPMVQHLVMMALIVAIPFILVMSAYSFKVAGLVTFSYFGLSTITIWFEISRWMSNNLVHMVYSSDAAKLGWIAGIGSTYDVGVLGLVQVAMQLLFPLIWISLLGWSGWQVGTGLGSLMSSGSKDVGSAGEKGPI
ncbi:MAG: conjugal transfer protein TraG N-terminal domain-containing protein, partial [Nitrosospira sp.]|nr:conjugal transfer protein TraG N-terminal domain-containing protein [Nitrosospira sp.]